MAQRPGICWRKVRKYARWFATERRRQAGRTRASNWSKATNAAAIERALKGVDGAFVMLPTIWAPSPDFKEAKGVIANYVEALTKAAPPRVVGLSSMGANRTSGLGMITALSLLEQGFRKLTSPTAFVRAGGFFENFLYGLHVAQGGTLPVYYNPTNRKSGRLLARPHRSSAAGAGQE